MFGYIGPQTSKMSKGEVALYKSFYCGACKSCGKKYGQYARLCTNFDITFFSIVMYDLLECKPQFAKEGCVFSPFARKMVVQYDELGAKLCAFNILFVYHSVLDGIKDDKSKGKKLFRRMILKSYLSAKQELPQIDEVIATQMHRLNELEQQNSANIDMVSDCFATMLAQSAALFLGEKSSKKYDEFFYHLGKWIYLADALDDIEQDFRKKSYNPLLAAYGNFCSREQFFADNKTDLYFLVHVTINKIIDSFNTLEISQSYDILQNVVYYGLRAKADEIFSAKHKLKKVRF